MSSKSLLDNSEEEETDLPKKMKLEHKLISETISNKHPKMKWPWNTKIFINVQLINRSRIR